jgi:signal transduction histidine kinase
MEETDGKFLERYGLEPVGLIRLDGKGAILETNQQGARMLKLSKAESRGEFRDYLCGDSKGRFNQHLAKTLRSSSIESCRVEIRGPDGAEANVAIQSVRIATSHSGAQCLMTLRAQPRPFLRKAPKVMTMPKPLAKELPRPGAEPPSFEAWIEVTDEAVLLLSPKREIERWNRRAEELFGATPEGLLQGKGFLELFKSVRSRQMVSESLDALGQRDATTVQWRSRIHGSPIKWTARILLSGDNEPIGFLAVGNTAHRQPLLERHVLQASEREQARIAQELHDGLGQQLVAISFLTEGLIRSFKSNPHNPLGESSRALEIRGLLAKAVDHTRDLAKGFLPDNLYSKGLLAAFQSLAEQTGKHSGLICRVETQGLERLKFKNKRVALHIYRIIQEAVQNAALRAGTREIVISYARMDPWMDFEVRSEQSAPSQGPAKPQGLSIHLMRYHARSIGAKLSIKTDPTASLTRCCVPVESASCQRLAPMGS